MKRIKNKGFTLIEVMISLFIFSIVSVAVIKNLSTAIRQSADLKDSLEARWVAEDYMTRMQMLPKTSENFPTAGFSRDSYQVGDQRWEVEVEVQETENQSVRRIILKVHRGLSEKNSAKLIGFLGRY
ncbi:type II secretion system minor pseudopilin GspI [Gammaproteobacteria bacterium]|nr:type II secretion system minor pseudopilin GspI [Gammaproteobacteria bacterium]